LAFLNFSVLRNKENFLKNFSQNSVNSALCGVIGNERIFNEGSVSFVDAGYVSPAGSVGVKRSPPATNAPTSRICPQAAGENG